MTRPTDQGQAASRGRPGGRTVAAATVAASLVVGEVGIIGAAPAIANAIYHATGKRIRDLPITLDKLL